MSTQPLPGDSSLPSTSEQLEALKSIDNRKHKYTIEDFFKVPDKAGYQISPDGQYISFIGPYQRRRNVFVQKVGSDDIQRITHETDRDIAGYAWANANRIIFMKDSGGDENFKLFAVDRDGQNAKDLTPYDGVRINIIDSLKDQEDVMIIGMNKNNPMLFDPYLINIHTGELKQLAVNDNPAEPIDHWITDNNGVIRGASQVIDGVNTRILYRENENEDFREVLTTGFKDQMMPVHFDRDNSSMVYALSNLGRDKTALVKYDLSLSKEVGDPIFVHDEVDVSSVLWSRKDKKITGVAYTTAKTEILFYDKTRKSLQEKWEAAFPGYEVGVANTDKDENHWMLQVYNDKTHGSYHIYNKITDKITKICDISPWLDEADMVEMKPIKYLSRDGLTINGYLSLPKNTEGKRIPIIVHPHGGPWVRDSWGYNPAIQLFASRGYGVLQMNYRSSTGYGKQFWEAGFKKWGKEMQDDITDGVQWLIHEGIADPDRVAIFGGSYGGYATLAGICYTPDLYACAIDFVGVSNLFTFMNTIPPYWAPYIATLHEMVGHPENDKEWLESASPAFHVDKIKTPLFVVQGANDPRVNIDESDQIVRSLRQRNIDVPYMVKYDEGHGFANEENKFEFYACMLGFLYGYLG